MRSFKKTTRRAIALLLVLVTIASIFAGCATHNTIVTGKMERSGSFISYGVPKAKEKESLRS